MSIRELNYDDFVGFRRKSRKELWKNYEHLQQSKEYWVRKAMRLEKWRLECEQLTKEYHDDE